MVYLSISYYTLLCLIIAAILADEDFMIYLLYIVCNGVVVHFMIMNFKIKNA